MDTITPRPPEGSVTTPDVLVEAINTIEKNRLTGIGGWLLLFIALEGLSFFEFIQKLFQGRPPMELTIFPQTAEHLLPFSQGLQVAATVMALAIPCVLALLLLQKKIAPRAAIAMLVCQMLVSLCLYAFVHYSIISLASNAPVSPEMMPEMADVDMYQLFSMLFISLEGIFSSLLVLRLLYSTVWIAYFCLSKRVRYTYGR